MFTETIVTAITENYLLGLQKLLWESHMIIYHEAKFFKTSHKLEI